MSIPVRKRRRRRWSNTIDDGESQSPSLLPNVQNKADQQLERLSSLGQTTPEVPAIKMGSPIDFFDDLCRKTDGGKKLPTWKGELYLELHRGVS
jgi:hypothetical protein